MLATRLISLTARCSMSRWRSEACSRRRAWRCWRRSCPRSPRRCGRRLWPCRGLPTFRCPMRSGGCGSWSWPGGTSGTYLNVMAVRCPDRSTVTCAARGTRRPGRAAREPAHHRAGPARGAAAGRARAVAGAAGAADRGRRRGGLDGRADGCGLAWLELSRSRSPLRGAAPPSFRAMEAGQDQQVLLLLLHHIAGDGWSPGPLWRDLAALYRARLHGVPAALRRCRCSTPTTPCGSARCWARRAMKPAPSRGSFVLEDGRLIGVLPEQIALPTDRPRPAVSSHRGAPSAAYHPGRPVHGQLAGLAQRTGASLFIQCCRRR